MRDWVEEWEDHLKQVVKEAIREYQEEDTDPPINISTLNLPCTFCKLPVTSGQAFVLHHVECLEKEQNLR